MTMSGFDKAPSEAAPAGNAPSDRSTDFTAVEGQEQYSGGTLLVVAYASIWVILMAWIFVLWRRSSTLGERLAGLEAAIDRAAAGKGSSSPKV
jgi:hypothetical protein